MQTQTWMSDWVAQTCLNCRQCSTVSSFSSCFQFQQFCTPCRCSHVHHLRNATRRWRFKSPDRYPTFQIHIRASRVIMGHSLHAVIMTIQTHARFLIIPVTAALLRSVTCSCRGRKMPSSPWSEPRQSFSSLITTPCQVFQVPEPIHCRIIAFLLLIHYFTLWPWPLTYLQSIACDVTKLGTKFERNRAIRGGVIAISIFDLMTLKMCYMLYCFQCFALGSEIILTKFDLRQLVHAWNPELRRFHADTLCHAVTLASDPLTLKVCGTSSVTWSKSVRNLSEIEQSLAEL